MLRQESKTTSTLRVTTAQPNSHGSCSEVLTPLELQVGSTYRFGVEFTDINPASNARATTGIDCELLVRIENRSPESAPFDPPASQAPASTGPGNR